MSLSIEFTRDQHAVLNAAARWYKSPDRHSKPLLVQGYAGTGKTSLAQHIAESLGVDAAYLAPTGRAAGVLREKIDRAVGIMTLHSAMYAPEPDDPELYAQLQRQLEKATDPRIVREIRAEMKRLMRNIEWVLQDHFRWMHARYEGNSGGAGTRAGLIIVDEASMVRADNGGDLMALARAYRIPVIATGDPGQLPPVNGLPAFTRENCVTTPVMHEIVRQRAGSEILKLAHSVREGKQYFRGEYGRELSIRSSKEKISACDFDMVICGFNAQRQDINDAERRAAGCRPGSLPAKGEPMIVLRNDHDLGVANGDVFEVVAVDDSDGLLVHGKFANGAIKPLDCRLERGSDTMHGAMPVDFAYAISCHKAQGSEWDHVAVLDCKFPDAERLWRYTAVTRAARHLTLFSSVRPDGHSYRRNTWRHDAARHPHG